MNQNTNETMKFTKLQKEEILHCISVRQDTVEEDIDSASPFEAKEGALDTLADKIMNGVMTFTPEEIEWLNEELDNRIAIAYCNVGTEGVRVFGYANSMQNAMDKL